MSSNLVRINHLNKKKKNLMYKILNRTKKKKF